MFQIGWFELLIVVILSIVIIGPEDFPVVLKKIGSWVGTVKRYFSDIQKNVNEMTSLEDQKDKKEDSLKKNDK